MSQQDPTLAQKMIGKLTALTVPPVMARLVDFRLAFYDPSTELGRPIFNEHVIFVFWHEYISIALGCWGHLPLSVLISQHRDGEWVSQVAESMGMQVVRGSSTRGGSGAIRQLKKNSLFTSLAITPDGPTGPRREMAMGPIYLAKMLQMPIVPIGIGMENPKRLNTWDEFALPRPFSRCRAIFGPKIRVDRRASRQDLESTRKKSQALLIDLGNCAEEWSQQGYRMRGEKRFARVGRRRRLVFTPPPKPVAQPSSQPDLSIDRVRSAA
ncbi:MAG: lysophospholipid acyltransferase family protein [Mariniblastus sp.]|nr:lysophospholipid acyltransferase family protein [Mariniblastus sp.]